MSQFLKDNLCNDFVNCVKCAKYASTTSVDVERSFSLYKTLLSDSRRAFAFENFRKHLIIQCYNEGKKYLFFYFSIINRLDPLLPILNSSTPLYYMHDLDKKYISKIIYLLI
jgi:hypothetical protein